MVDVCVTHLVNKSGNIYLFLTTSTPSTGSHPGTLGQSYWLNVFVISLWGTLFWHVAPTFIRSVSIISDQATTGPTWTDIAPSFQWSRSVTWRRVPHCSPGNTYMHHRLKDHQVIVCNACEMTILIGKVIHTPSGNKTEVWFQRLATISITAPRIYSSILETSH